MTDAVRLAEVRARLDRVTDPELDEPVTELRFVTDIDIDAAGRVAIGFRLPTYWCAANFAFMMADDMRREVLTLPWVSGVDICLGEHMYAEQINAGIARGLGFKETFGDAASGDLHDLRRTFLVKAFQRRQEALLRHLLAAGYEPERLVALHGDELAGLPLDAAGRALALRYLERRAVAADAGGLAFVDPDGGALSADSLGSYLQDIRRIGIGAEFNAALCKGLLAARFGEAPPESTAANGEPGLFDFARMAPTAERPRHA
jgi:metal-sulfur cluster biosynthetic enzyme